MAFKTITVPGHGEIDFPDSMSDDDIATAIRVNIIGAGAAESPAPAEKPSLLSRAVSAVKRVVSPEPKPTLSDEEWAAQVASEADLKAAEKAGRKTPSYMEMGGTGLPIRPMKPTPDRPAAPVSAPAGTRYDIAGATSYPDRPRPEKTVSAPAGTRYDIAGARAVVKPEAFTPPTEEEYLEVKAKREAAWKKAWEKDNVAARRLGFKVGDEYPTAEAAIRAYRESVGEPLPEAPATFEDYISERAAQYESERALKAQSEDLGREFEAEQRRRKKARSEADDKYAVKARARGMTTPEYMKSIGLEPYKEPYASPEAFAEERTGVPRGAGPVGRAMASAGDAWSDVAGATGWALVSRAITGKTKAERTGERIMQTEAALEEAKRVRAAKAKRAAGEELTEVERRTLESNRFFAQLGAAVEAVRENPGEAAEAILVDLIENAPVYALTNMGTVGAAKAITGAVKSTNNARRLANALAKGKSAAAAEIRAQRTAELGAKVIKPSALKTIGIEVAADVPADVAVGMVLEKARGRDYKAADLVTDLALSGIINVPIGVVRSMKTGGILTPREFRQVADAFGDIGALATEPAVAEILGRLRTLSADEVLIPEGLKVSATGRAKAVSPEEARAAGYGEDVSAGPEAGRQILGSTDGADVKLRPGADLATLEEEIQTARFNVLRKRAAAGGAEESALLQRINDWADAVHAENAARPEGQRVALPQQSEAGNLELFTKVLAGDETGIELVPLVDVPDDIFNEWGRIFNTRVRTGETEPRPGVMTGRPVQSAAAALEQPVASATPETPAVPEPPSVRTASAADPPVGPAAARPSVMEAVGTLPPEAAAAVRRPLPTEPPAAIEGLTPRGKTQEQLDAEARAEAEMMNEVRRDVGRLKRRPLPQYQLAGEAGAGRAELAAARKAWAEKGVESPYFKKWFGDSKVVDAEGKPLVVYHGTDKDFEAFEPRTRKGEQMAFGTHFSEGPEIANRYADPEQQSRSKKVSGQNVVPSYITAKNPLYADAVVSEGSPEFDLAKKLLGNKMFSVKNEDGIPSVWLQNALDAVDPKKAEKAIREAGYDAVRYNAKITGRGLNAGNVAAQGRSWIVFSPTQIKSATGNRGTFSSTDPRINYQLRGNRPLTPVTEQARQRAVDVARTVLASDKPMSAQTAAAKAGLKGKMAEEAAKRAIPIIKAVRQGKSYDEALAQDVLKRIMQKPSETIKQTILRTTEGKITGTEIVSAKAVLESLIRQSQLKADLEAAKTANREMRRIQRLIVAASKKALDPELQGQMLAAVRDARTQADLSAAMTRITTILSREQLKETVTRLEGLLKIDANKMEPQFRDAFKAIAGDIDAGRGDAAARKYREWYEAQDDKPEIPKRFVKAMERIKGDRMPSRGDIRSMEPERLAEEQAKWSSIADALATIASSAEDARELRFKKDTLKLELTVNQVLKEVAKENPDEIPSGKKPNIIKRAIRYGSSPEYLIMLAGGRDGILHNVLFKRPAASMSNAYMSREEMRNIMKDFFVSQGKSEQDLIRWRNEKFTVKTDAGKALTLTRPEAVSFYATLANDESRRLIEGNGIQKWEDRGTKRDYKLSDADIARIKSQMTDFDVRTAETMLAIFDHYKSKLNEASIILEGYEKFTVENYFPRMASQDYLDKNLTNLREFWNAVMLEQDGFTKEREAHGKPLIIADAMNVFDRHIHDAAMYANMAVPLRNAARLIGNSDVSAEIAKRLGGGLEKQIQDFLFDASGMNGRAMMDDVSKFYRMMLRSLSVGILGYRPTTIVNNLFGASVQTYAEIPEKYRADFIKNWTTMTPAEERAIFNEMKAMDAYFDHRYSRDPYRLATWGNTEMPETVGSSELYIQFKKMQDHSMKWMQNAERRAAVAAYKAIRDRTSRADAVSELSKRFRDASDASNPVKEYAAHETMILTRRTQNAIDALDKSAFSRKMSENPLAMSSFMFTSQLYKLRDMVLMASLDYKRGNITKAEYARKMALIMTSAAAIPTFASLVWREIKEGGKERKESEEQKRMGAGLMMLLNSVEIVDPMVGSIVRAIADATRGGQGGGQRGQPIAQAVDKLTRNLTKALNKRDEESLDAFIAALGAGASIGGVPSAPFEALGAAVKFFRPDDPLIPYYNKKFKIEEKFGIHEPTGRKRTLQQALRAGVKLTPEEIREYKTASSIIEQGLKMRRLANEGHITDDQAEKIIEQRTKKP